LVRASLPASALRIGRATSASRTVMEFADGLPYTTTQAAIKLGRLLGRIDAFIADRSLHVVTPPPEPLAPVLTPPSPTRLDLRAEGIRTVLWTTGYRRHYPWLHVPVLDTRGELQHDRGVIPAPGLYVLGLQFLRRRKSSFIDGVGDDARALSRTIAGRLRHLESVAA